MKVYVLFKDKYEGREVLGVFTSLEAAQKCYPAVSWEQREKYDYEEAPPIWEDAARGFDHRDYHIEEHDLDARVGPERLKSWLRREEEELGL